MKVANQLAIVQLLMLHSLICLYVYKHCVFKKSSRMTKEKYTFVCTQLCIINMCILAFIGNIKKLNYFSFSLLLWNYEVHITKYIHNCHVLYILYNSLKLFAVTMLWETFIIEMGYDNQLVASYISQKKCQSSYNINVVTRSSSGYDKYTVIHTLSRVLLTLWSHLHISVIYSFPLWL